MVFMYTFLCLFIYLFIFIFECIFEVILSIYTTIAVEFQSHFCRMKPTDVWFEETVLTRTLVFVSFIPHGKIEMVEEIPHMGI